MSGVSPFVGAIQIRKDVRKDVTAATVVNAIAYMISVTVDQVRYCCTIRCHPIVQQSLSIAGLLR